MTNVAEIASIAGQVSYDKLVERYESVEVSTLKSAMEAQAMIAEQLASMLLEVSPHLGNNVNILV